MAEFVNNFDEDPAADFLAREQNELAGLEDEVKPAAISVTVVNGGNVTYKMWEFGTHSAKRYYNFHKYMVIFKLTMSIICNQFTLLWRNLQNYTLYKINLGSQKEVN